MLIWFYFGILLLMGIYVSTFVELNLTSSFLKFIVLSISLLMIYSNVCLLFNLKKHQFRRFIVINKWANFSQIIHLSLIGINFYLIVGIHILFYYSYDVTQKIGIGYDFIDFTLVAKYFKSDVIIVGINLIPLIIFLIYNRKLNLLDRNAETELITK